MSKYTPGPWKKGNRNDCHKIFSEKREIAQVNGSTRGRTVNPRHEESQANARIIAEAPNMINVLWKALDAIQSNHHLVTNHQERMTNIFAESAILKILKKIGEVGPNA